MDDEQQIRDLIERWAAAVHAGDRLRLTFGLVKERGRWVIQHEHHSFPHGAAD